MYSTLSRPFLEENDVSRQAVKPIYAVDPGDISQTQRTEQTLVSSAAVRTGLKTASEFTETYYTSDIISSHHSEVNICYNIFLQLFNLLLLNSKQTLGTFITHLKNCDFKKPFIISINNTHTETHVLKSIYNDLPKNHYILPTHLYNLYQHIPILTNNTNNSNNLYFNIATHNVRGYNTSVKRQLWEQYCIENSLNIISITETKITNLPTNKYLNIP